MAQSRAGVEHASVVEHCKQLKLPTVAAQFKTLAAEATQQQHSHVRYLEALFCAEIEERERKLIEKRIKEAKLPRVKTLEEFDFAANPKINARQMAALAEGQYLPQSEPIIFIGDSGTGKSHLATSLCVAACRQKKRARFTTAAALVNDLVEAKHNQQLQKTFARWSRYELIVVDELGYVPLAEAGAELIFQVVAERAEKAALIITTNLPFSEWITVIPSARLCKALLDRVTDRAHIIETGTDSYRFKRTLEKKKRKS